MDGLPMNSLSIALLSILLATVQPAHADESLSPIVSRLTKWISTKTRYSAQTPAPTLRIVSEAELTEMYRREAAGSGAETFRPRAIYLLQTRTIYLREDIDPRSSIVAEETLMHELVHHMQYAAGADKGWACANYGEREAYRLGALFHTEFNSAAPDLAKIVSDHRKLALLLAYCKRER